MNERIVVFKERYLLLAEYDYLKAEILAKLDAHGDWIQLSAKDWQEVLHVSVPLRTLRDKRAQLIENGLMEQDTNCRPKRYRLGPVFYKKVEKLGLNLIEGFVMNPDKMSDFDAKFTYENPKNEQSKWQTLPPNPKTGHFKWQTLPPNPNIEHSDQTKCPTERQTLPLKDENKWQTLPLNDPEKISTYNRELYTSGITSVDVTTDTTSDVNPDTTSDVNPDTSSDVNLKSTHVVTDVLFSKSKNSSFGPGKKNRFYDWEHYAKFTEEDWTKAKNFLTWPGKESGPTMIIGACLLAKKQKRNIREGLADHQFGLLLRESKRMLEYFSDYTGDAVKGFNMALDWVRFFVSLPVDSFEGKSSWSIRMCLKPTMYTKYASGGYQVKTGKKRNNTGEMILTQEQRDEAMANSQLIDVTKYLQ